MGNVEISEIFSMILLWKQTTSLSALQGSWH